MAQLSSLHAVFFFLFYQLYFREEIVPVIWRCFLHLLPLFNPSALFGSHYSPRFFSKKVIQSDYTSALDVSGRPRVGFGLVGHTEGM